MALVPTIGLEIHVQLDTKTKIFCGCKTSFGDKPNANTCPVCLGLPGALPVFNKEVLTKAIKAGLAIGATIHNKHRFDRKNYFYPDSPKAYQISQFALPYCTGGGINITKSDGNEKTINITRIHMEEDAGKLMHSENPSVPESYVDLNRSGTPLIEIVTEPEVANSDEAYLFLNKLKSMLEYIEVSDCNMEQGSLRCDANVSVAEHDSEQLGTRTEIKNLNSFKAIRAAIDYEIERQIDVIESGGKISQETRLWNTDLEQTVIMRSKEEAHDYRYFPDPDLVPFETTNSTIEGIKAELPELAQEKTNRYKAEFSLSDHDAKGLTASKDTAVYFEQIVKAGGIAKKAANWVLSEMLAMVTPEAPSLNDLCKPDDIATLLQEVEKGTISGKIAKTVFQAMVTEKKDPHTIIKEKGLVQISDSGELTKVVKEVLDANPDSVASIKAGKDKAIGFLVGQVMKKTQGKANPGLVNKIIKENL